jgi:hypothetical protein
MDWQLARSSAGFAEWLRAAAGPEADDAFVDAPAEGFRTGLERRGNL